MCWIIRGRVGRMLSRRRLLRRLVIILCRLCRLAILALDVIGVLCDGLGLIMRCWCRLLLVRRRRWLLSCLRWCVRCWVLCGVAWCIAD